ncbi:MAG: hypothetical protein ACRC8Y_21935 [Chroococcales cyanobacterium]
MVEKITAKSGKIMKPKIKAEKERDQFGQYRPQGEKPLSRKVISTKLPSDVEEKIRKSLTDSKQPLSDWLRIAALEKAEREGMI